MNTEEANDNAQKADSITNKSANESEISVAPGISVPQDSNIVGGGASGEGADIGTASGTSDSGGG